MQLLERTVDLSVSASSIPDELAINEEFSDFLLMQDRRGHAMKAV